MAFQYSTAVRNAALDPIESTIGTSPRLYLYTGSPPANCAAAATGTLLNSASYSLPADWMGAASGGVKSIANGPWTVTANASGTAGYFRILDSTGTTVGIQGTVGTSGTDMILDNNVIVSGQAVSITAFTITAGGA